MGSRTLVAAAVLALLVPAAALAERVQVRTTAEGQADARAAVLTRADIGNAPGWTGGATKPDLSGTPPCAGFHPKQSDLVVTGAAASEWKHAGLALQSQVQVYATARMVQLDWQRTVLPPQVIPCLRSGLQKQFGSSARIVSIGWTSFPKVAAYTRALRVQLDVSTANGSVPAFLDVVAFGRGRTESTLSATAQLAASGPVREAEVRLARILASRIRA